MIKPTIGRVVWFYKAVAGQSHKGPLAAIVTKVHFDTMVNLAVFNEDGVSHGETSVILKQDPQEFDPACNFCEWMPYQVGQAAKYEDLAKSMAATEK